MGMGYNIANTFDSFSYFIDFETPDEQIELNGNIAPTKDMIKKIKKYGFKTIRFPVTWMYFIDDEGNINSEWMARVKEVIDIIIKEKLYCILNVHNDGYYTNWLIRGMEVKDKYINLWSQIANKFKDYNEYLIFESMDKVNFFDYNLYHFDYKTLINLNQAFVDTIRNSGGNNKERLLIIAGANADITWTCSSEYKIPVDQSNKLALSVHYLEPNDFVYDTYYEPYNTTSYDGLTYLSSPKLIWGSYSDYFKMTEDFELIKKTFVDKGIPVIINKLGVLTEEKKEMQSIREYLYMLFSLSLEFDGIMCCLWDTSNKAFGDMNFYDRTNDIWYDEKLKNNFLKISKRKNIKPKDYYINTNFKTSDILISFDTLLLTFDNKKVLKIFINARITGVLFVDFDLSIYTINKYGHDSRIEYGKENVKKQYDGTHVIEIDMSRRECYDYVEATVIWGIKYITLNNLTLEFEESFQSYDYKSLKNAISNYIY
jgi:endoglucanase